MVNGIPVTDPSIFTKRTLLETILNINILNPHHDLMTWMITGPVPGASKASEVQLRGQVVLRVTVSKKALGISEEISW